MKPRGIFAAGRPAVLALLLVLLAAGPAQAARGNSLQEHVLSGVEAPAKAAEAATPAWQEINDDSMDAARKILEEYALNTAEEDTYPMYSHEGDAITKARLAILQQSVQEAAAEEQAAGHSPAAALPAAVEDLTTTASRSLLHEDGADAAAAAAAEAQEPAAQEGAAEDLAPAWQDVVNTMEASRRLLQATGNTTQLKEQAKAVLLASDAFGMVYTGGNFARAIFALLAPMVVAGQTGMVAVDANYLLNLSQLMAQFVAMLGDLLSKGARLTADGIAPV